MSSRAALELTRASWRTAKSYRVSFVVSFISLLVTIIPVYFVASALQPFMASIIAEEAREYFGFVLLGTVLLTVVSTALTSFAASVSGGLSSGFFEALLATPTPLPALLIGQTGYAFAWALGRMILLMTAGLLLGVEVQWARLPEALLLFGLVVAAYVGIGLLAAGFVVSFRHGPAGGARPLDRPRRRLFPDLCSAACGCSVGGVDPVDARPPSVAADLASWIPAECYGRRPLPARGGRGGVYAGRCRGAALVLRLCAPGGVTRPVLSVIGCDP